MNIATVRVVAAALILVCVPAVPPAAETVEAFEGNSVIRAHGELGTTPEGALKLWFDAVFLYLDEGSREQGREALTYLTIPFKSEAHWERRPSFSTFTGRLRDPAHHHIFRSYARGAAPDNGYAMDPADWELAVVEGGEDRHGRGYRVLVRSSGADSPRPVYLRRSTTTGLWYVDQFANVYVGVRAPVDPKVELFE